MESLSDCGKHLFPIMLVLFICLFPSRASSQTDQLYELSLPQEIAFLGTGASLITAEHFIRDYHSTLTEDDISGMSRSDVCRFDRSATYNWSSFYDRASNYTRNASFALPLTLILSQTVRNDIFTVGLLYVETGLIAEGISGFLKSYVGRPRPYVYNGKVDLDEKTNRDAVRSFPSGHTKTAFYSSVFFSTVFSDYYPDSKWKYPVWSVSLMLAAATGYFRYKAGQHYPSDILAGAAIGAGAGYLVPCMHRRAGRRVLILPIVNPDSVMLGFMIKF